MKKALIPIILATAGLTATASPVDAHRPHHRPQHREVTHGHFETLAGGTDLGYHIHGRAVMVRSDRHGGATAVVVRVRGLDADTTYPTHVHNQPCSASPPGGSHYQNVVDGPVDAVNEIWPTVTTDRLGRGFGFAEHDARARDDAMSIVIHYSRDTSIRLACVDLT